MQVPLGNGRVSEGKTADLKLLSHGEISRNSRVSIIETITNDLFFFYFCELSMYNQTLSNDKLFAIKKHSF